MLAFKFSDILIMIISFVTAVIVIPFRLDNISLTQFLDMRIKIVNFVLFLSLILLWHFTFSFYGLYLSKRLSMVKKEIIDIVKATSMGTLAIYIFSILYKISLVTPFFIICFWTSSTLITILTRLVLRYILSWIRRQGRNLRYLIIVGTNSKAVEIANKIESEKEIGYVLLGFVDEGWSGLDEFKKNGYPLIADFNGFTKFIRNNVVDEVLISLPVKSYYQKTNRIIASCESQGILVKHLSNVYNTKLSNSKLEYFNDESFVSHYTGSMNEWQVVIKRILDIIVSSIMLILFAPIFLFIPIIIKITSPGPVLFVQERVGLNKRRFKLYKFRTMFKDAELKQTELENHNEVVGPVFKIKNDPRITKVGRILRKTSLDEIPQLLNVLKGDMSLVGPRPLPVRDYMGFDKDWHRRRFSIRPGITCLWQVNGRSNIPFEKWMEMDMEYIDRWSLWLDLKILTKTIPAVLQGIGAE